jgi:hypothetical protein
LLFDLFPDARRFQPRKRSGKNVLLNQGILGQLELEMLYYDIYIYIYISPIFAELKPVNYNPLTSKYRKRYSVRDDYIYIYRHESWHREILEL